MKIVEISKPVGFLEWRMARCGNQPLLLHGKLSDFVFLKGTPQLLGKFNRFVQVKVFPVGGFCQAAILHGGSKLIKRFARFFLNHFVSPRENTFG